MQLNSGLSGSDAANGPNTDFGPTIYCSKKMNRYWVFGFSVAIEC